MAALIDQEALLERVSDDPEFLAHMVAVFVADVPQRIDAIRSAIARADAHAVERAAHSLKGALATMAADAAAADAFRIEQAGRSGSLAEAARLLHGLEAQIPQVNDALHALTHRLSQPPAS
jgi:HPt (histidine-containing phosphotransfer) domain-containing protein